MKFIAISGDNNEKIQELENMNIENETFKEGLNELGQVVKFIRIFVVPE